jgi:hypothetical protein
MKNLFETAAAVAIVAGVANITSVESHALPSPFGANDYEFVQVANPYSANNNSWSTAFSSATASTFSGVNGHLATVTSQAENDFLLSLVPSGVFTSFTGAWLGGKAPEGWLTGPESGSSFTYTHWVGIEPNNAGYAYMSIGGGYGTGGFWADDSDSGAPEGIPNSFFDPVIGYFVEYEGTAAHGVPDMPNTFALLGFAFVGMISFKRTFKNN